MYTTPLQQCVDQQCDLILLCSQVRLLLYQWCCCVKGSVTDYGSKSAIVWHLQQACFLGIWYNRAGHCPVQFRHIKSRRPKCCVCVTGCIWHQLSFALIDNSFHLRWICIMYAERATASVVMYRIERQTNPYSMVHNFIHLPARARFCWCFLLRRASLRLISSAEPQTRSP